MSSPRGAGRRVLIVDDDAGIRLLLLTFLRHRGFQLREARDGREALHEMRAGNADVVVMDLMMPEVSGWEVLRERAHHPALLRIPVIVITAMNTEQATVSVAGNRVSALLAKPFDLDALLAAITTSLGGPGVPTPLAA
jgi:DNA-binding response OmpR family regulator